MIVNCYCCSLLFILYTHFSLLFLFSFDLFLISLYKLLALPLVEGTRSLFSNWARINCCCYRCWGQSRWWPPPPNDPPTDRLSSEVFFQFPFCSMLTHAIKNQCIFLSFFPRLSIPHSVSDCLYLIWVILLLLNLLPLLLPLVQRLLPSSSYYCKCA